LNQSTSTLWRKYASARLLVAERQRRQRRLIDAADKMNGPCTSALRSGSMPARGWEFISADIPRPRFASA